MTGWLQTLYYGITIRAGDPKPQPNTPRYVKHRRRIYITVVLVYLAYTIYEADYYVRQAGDFYQLLGVPLDADERTIKSRFRRLAALHHPDKVQSVLGAEKDNGAIDSYFVSLKTAQDTLTNSVKRYAYDRFGPDFLQWQQQSSSIQDYFWAGLPAASGFYIGSYILMFVLGTLGYVNWGRYVSHLIKWSMAIADQAEVAVPDIQRALHVRILRPVTDIRTSHTYFLHQSTSYKVHDSSVHSPIPTAHPRPQNRLHAVCCPQPALSLLRATNFPIRDLEWQY